MSYYRRARLLKTGQFTQYGGYPCDGFHQKGISKGYNVLTTGQYSGTVEITLNSKADVKSNNCVLDNKTGLMWSRYVSASVGPASDGKLPWTTAGSGATEEGIFAYVAAANVAGLGGYGDWRVPNVREMKSIFTTSSEVGNLNNSPDTTAFPSFPAPSINGALWTSSTRPEIIANAFRVNRNFGDDLDDVVKTSTHIVLLVRGG